MVNLSASSNASFREQTMREFCGMLLEFPGLIRKSKRVEDLLLTGPYVLSVDGDIARKVTVDDDGVLTLISSDRGNDRITFVTNSVRACVVRLVYQVLNDRADFYPGRSPYEEAPCNFKFEERIVLDEFEIERVVIRWSWEERYWAEIAYPHSLLEGLKWAWMFTSSDQTIKNCLLDRDGHPLFRPTPGPKLDVPAGDLQNLSLSEWEQWRAELLSPEVDH